MENAAQSTASVEVLASLLREINSAIRKLGIYPPGHPASVKAAEKPFTILRDLLQSNSRIVIAIAEGKLLGNGEPLDDKFLNDGLGRILSESGLSSIVFEANLLFEEFEKLLAHLNAKREQRNLDAFLKAESVHGITVGKLQYQLVGDHERVVSSDVADSLTGGAADIQQTLVGALRDHPDLLLRLLARPRGTEGRFVLPGGTGGSGQSDGMDKRRVGGRGWGSGPVVVGSTVDTAALQLPANQGMEDQVIISRQLSQFSDDELLGLLTAALRERVGNTKYIDRLDVGNTLFAFKELLSGMEAPHLLPRLKQSIESLNIVDGSYLDLILSADSSPKKVAHVELENFKTDFFLGSAPPGSFGEISGWLETIGDKQYTNDFVGTFYADLEKQAYDLTVLQMEVMLSFASIGAEYPDSQLAQSQLHELKERLADPAISLNEFHVLSDQAEAYYLKFIELGRYEEANAILHHISEKLNTEIIYADGVADLAYKIARRFTSANVTESLMGKLTRNFDVICKPMTPLIENFYSLEAMLVLASYLANPNRGVRMLLIRILSGFGERTLAAFKLILTDKTLTARQPGQAELSTDSWYKVRNLILILSNIPHPDSVAIVRQFAGDLDLRVVVEAVIALEKLGGELAAQTLSKLLSHRNEEVQIKALHSLMQIGSEKEYPYVEEYFLRNISLPQNTLPALIKLDRQRSLNFLASVLLGESEAYKKHYVKPDEELNETIVRTFIQLRSVIFDDVLRKYVKNNTRSLLGQFRKSSSVKLAERYLRTVSDGL